MDPSRPPGSPLAGSSRRMERVLFAAIFLCVAGAHIWLAWMAPTALSFSTDHLHTDNAVMPLMAKHMLEKGEFPIFYYGQTWFGSLSAMAHAGVFLVLGGIPPWSIHVVPLLFFLGFSLILYLLTRDDARAGSCPVRACLEHRNPRDPVHYTAPCRMADMSRIICWAPCSSGCRYGSSAPGDSAWERDLH